jgi:hypothetical protein
MRGGLTSGIPLRFGAALFISRFHIMDLPSQGLLKPYLLGHLL